MSALVAHGRGRAWLEIDLDALRHNVRVIRDAVGPTTAVAPVIKADAYGHGVDVVGPAIAAESDAFCVATVDEAIALRHIVDRRVLVLYPVPGAAAAEVAASGIEPTVMSESDLEDLSDGLASDTRAGLRPVLRLQLCVETGMGRGGLPVDRVAAVAAAIEADRRLELAGIWTHAASPEDPDASGAQVSRFRAAVASMRAAGLPVPPRHFAASGGIFAGHVPSLEMVRPGLAIYGVLGDELTIPGHLSTAAAGLRPAMALKARAVAISDIPEGGSVGYGGHWTAERPSRVAILPVGYGDGYLRASQPGAEALLRGRRLPLVGVISMDALAVDVTDVPGVGQADEFVLLGAQAGDAITAVELARRRNTIAQEVLTSMARRLGRVYYPLAVPSIND